MDTNLITIEAFIMEQERSFYPEATGVFSNLLYDIALVAKVVSRDIRRAGLMDILGRVGTTNIQGEQQMKLDVLANDAIVRLNSYTGRVAIIASEELQGLAPMTPIMTQGKYVLIVDPLDGSSNIDTNVTVGTIFSIFRRRSPVGTPGTIEDCLQPGRDLVAAGYICYGSSTMLVYTAGNGVHGFTLEPSVGEFLLSHPNITIPEPPEYFSTNSAYEKYWSPGIRRFDRYLRGLEDEAPPAKLSARYVGSLVADFHRNLLKGGIFYYPLLYKEPHKPQPKLRLLYEAAPLAFIARQAGGYASDGERDILDIEPQSLHQRTALFVGNRSLVEKAEAYLREEHRT